jgi:hypothetical protein
MSLVLGIDYSSHAIDIVSIDEDTLAAIWQRYDLNGHDAFERTRDVRWCLGTAWKWDDVVAVGIEDPAGMVGSVRALARIQGAILSQIPRDILVQPWQPSQWRKAVGLSGRAGKDDVARWASGQRHMCAVRAAVMKWPEVNLDPWPQDACDAYAVALATLRTLKRADV